MTTVSSDKGHLPLVIGSSGKFILYIELLL